jgi:hypothetical protein
MEALQIEEAKAVGNAIEGVYEAVRDVSHVVGAAPREFVSGRFDRLYRSDADLQEAWRQSQDGDRRSLDSHISRITREMEGHINRLHGDNVPDDSGSNDKNTQAVCAYVKERAGLPEHFPNALVEDFLEDVCNNSPNPAEIAERAKNPIALQEMLNDAGRGLRTAANALINSTRPEPEKPFGLDTADMMDLSDKDWSKVKSAVRRRNELAKDKRR